MSAPRLLTFAYLLAVVSAGLAATALAGFSGDLCNWVDVTFR